jgi:hypothetical protein
MPSRMRYLAPSRMAGGMAFDDDEVLSIHSVRRPVMEDGSEGARAEDGILGF